MRKKRPGIAPHVRDALEEIQKNMLIELVKVDKMIVSRTPEDGLTDFHWLRLHNAIENAVEMYDDVLNPEQFDDDDDD